MTLMKSMNIKNSCEPVLQSITFGYVLYYIGGGFGCI